MNEAMKDLYKNVVLILTVVFLLSGCDHNFDRKDEMDSNLNHEETAADTQAETIDVIAENPNMKVENNLPVIQPSSQLEDIIYDGEVKNLQGAVAGRENIFFYGYTENGINGIFIMKVGESA